mgnify:CR=1 FL=1|tara:strand:+ start:646 stop:1131 length:486 start_codon:yes stop_codon:yes gene_type:complete
MVRFSKFVLLLTLWYPGVVYAQIGQTFTAPVSRVADGDTITVVHGGDMTRIRLDGIDTPEMDQAFGVQARMFTSSRVSDRQVIVTVHDVDRYGRFVGRVQIDGVDLSVALVSEGLAWHYTRYSDDAVLARAEAEARTKKIGLWTQQSPVPPWEFRRQVRSR